MTDLALIIKTDGTAQTVPLPKNPDKHLELFHNAVDGYIEAVSLPDGLLMYANEEGLLRQLPANPKATLLVHMCRGPFPTLVGDVIVVGFDGSPDAVGIDDKWIPMLSELELWPAD